MKPFAVALRYRYKWSNIFLYVCDKLSWMVILEDKSVVLFLNE